MPINILMPALSPTMEKGNLAKWLKKEGDTVKSGDVIAEIETDKATMEVEAVDEGVIAKILVPEGTQDVPVNDVIAVMAGDGEDVKAAGAGAASPAPKAAEAPAAKPAAAAPAPAAAAAPAAESPSACGSTSREPGAAGQWSCAHLLVAPGSSSGQGGRYRAWPHQRVRPARPCRRARRRGSEVRQGTQGSGRGAVRGAQYRALDVGQADSRAVRTRLLRGDPA